MQGDGGRVAEYTGRRIAGLLDALLWWGALMGFLTQALGHLQMVFELGQHLLGPGTDFGVIRCRGFLI